jgi:hypothetical protein
VAPKNLDSIGLAEHPEWFTDGMKEKCIESLDSFAEWSASPHDDGALRWLEAAPCSWRKKGVSFGCSLCFNFAQANPDDVAAKSEFSCFKVVARQWKASSLAKHAASKVHQRAFEWHVGSVGVPVGSQSLTVGMPMETQSRLPDEWSGHVPQPGDFLRWWGQIMANQSLRKSALNNDIESYIAGVAGIVKNRCCALQQRRNLNQLKALTCLAESLRDYWRQALSKCVAITVSFDAAGAFMAIRFRATTIDCHVVVGLLGVVRGFGVSTESILDGTAKSQKHCDGFRELLPAFATSMHGNRDADLEAHLAQHVQTVVADGEPAAQLAARLAVRTLFRNALLVVRDAVHEFRKCLEKPVDADEWWSICEWQIFKKKNAPGKMLSYSDVASADLRAAQEVVQQVDQGQHGGRLQKRLKDYGYCDARYEKKFTPWESFLLTVNAFALVLSMTVDNPKKDAAVRLAHEETLATVMKPKMLLFLAMMTDWNQCCLAELRVQDASDPDIALLPRQVRRWMAEGKKLFLDGTILSNDNSTHSKETMTAIIIEQLKQKRQFYFGSKAVFLNDDDLATHGKEALRRVQRIVHAQTQMMTDVACNP